MSVFAAQIVRVFLQDGSEPLPDSVFAVGDGEDCTKLKIFEVAVDEEVNKYDKVMFYTLSFSIVAGIFNFYFYTKYMLNVYKQKRI